jgi:hypothetical protein
MESSFLRLSNPLWTYRDPGPGSSIMPHPLTDLWDPGRGLLLQAAYGSELLPARHSVGLEVGAVSSASQRSSRLLQRAGLTGRKSHFRNSGTALLDGAQSSFRAAVASAQPSPSDLAGLPQVGHGIPIS